MATICNCLCIQAQGVRPERLASEYYRAGQSTGASKHVCAQGHATDYTCYQSHENITGVRSNACPMHLKLQSWNIQGLYKQPHMPDRLGLSDLNEQACINPMIRPDLQYIWLKLLIFVDRARVMSLNQGAWAVLPLAFHSKVPALREE